MRSLCVGVWVCVEASFRAMKTGLVPSGLGLRSYATHSHHTPLHAAKAAVCSALCSAFLIGAPAHAIPVADAIVLSCEAIFLVLQKVRSPEATSALVTDIADVVFQSTGADDVAKAVDLGIDAFLSVPPTELAAFSAVVKEQYNGVDASNCALVSLVPAPETLARVAKASAAAKVDAAKLRALNEAVQPTLGLVPKTASAVCLPPDAAALSKIALAQRALTQSVDPDAGRAFGAQAAVALRPIPLGDLIGPALSFQDLLLGDATLQQRQAVKLSTGKLEAAVKIEAAKAQKAR